MLKKLELQDCFYLYDLLINPYVLPFVRQKPNSYDEYLTITREIIEKEEEKELITRVILNEKNIPIGTISLFDLNKNTGFLGTWLGRDYHGKGYNQLAKELFFDECFYKREIDIIYLKIRKVNNRSKNAALKLPYIESAEHIYFPMIDLDVYDVFMIKKEVYIKGRTLQKTKGT